MAKKRQAIYELNHDNWDKEEEPEDPGHFREAGYEELKNRVIKKARRRVIGEDCSNKSNSIFGAFSGFSNSNLSTKTAVNATPFAFLSKLPTFTPSSVTTSNTSTSTSAIVPTFSFESEKKKTETSNSNEKTKIETVYYSKVIKLNNTFCHWIVKHVNEQPLCNLLPILKEYENFLAEIEQDTKKKKNTEESFISKDIIGENNSSASTSFTPSFSNFKFNLMSTSTKPIEAGNTLPSSIENPKSLTERHKYKDSSKANASSFTFGIKPTEKTNGIEAVSAGFNFNQTKTNGDSQQETSKVSSSFIFSGPSTTLKSDSSEIFSFGIKPDIKTPPGFSFGIQKTDNTRSPANFNCVSESTFTFANIKPPVTEASKENNADDDDGEEPPKVEVKEFVEEDALYTKRCKVFLKKDNAYKDHGICTFYLKPVNDSEKTQLLVRSNNNLGTILINVLLVVGMPTQRMGKNNVILVHPDHDNNGKPQTTLFRVKDGAEANELLEMINKHKK